MSTTFLLLCFVCLKGSIFETRKNVFVFHFKSSFRSWDNQILIFQIFKCHDIIKCLSIKRKTFYWIIWEVNTVWSWNLASLCITSKEKFLSENYIENMTQEPGTNSRPFLIFKESSVKRNLRRPACWFGLISIALLLHI